MARCVGDFDLKQRCVLTAHETGHQADAASGVQVHASDVSSADELVVHEHPGALGLAGLLGHVGLRHLNRGVARCVGDFDLKQRRVLTAHETGHQADAAVGVQVHLGDVGDVDELVVHEHPRTLSQARFLGQFGLGHHGLGVAGAVGNLDHEGRCVLTAHETGHQANAAAGFQVHLGDVGGADQLVVHEHPRALGLVGLLGDFVLGHLDRGVARCVCNLNFKHLFVLHGCSPLEAWFAELI